MQKAQFILAFLFSSPVSAHKLQSQKKRKNYFHDLTQFFEIA